VVVLRSDFIGQQVFSTKVSSVFLSSNSEAFSKFQVTAVRFPFKFVKINPLASEATKVTLQNDQLLVIVKNFTAPI
jgi:hypothetical protein